MTICIEDPGNSRASLAHRASQYVAVDEADRRKTHEIMQGPLIFDAGQNVGVLLVQVARAIAVSLQNPFRRVMQREQHMLTSKRKAPFAIVIMRDEVPGQPDAAVRHWCARVKTNGLWDNSILTVLARVRIAVRAGSSQNVVHDRELDHSAVPALIRDHTIPRECSPGARVMIHHHESAEMALTTSISSLEET